MTNTKSMQTNDMPVFAITGISLDIPKTKQTPKITAMELKQPLTVKKISIDYTAKPISLEPDLSIDRDATKNVRVLQPQTNRKYGTVSMAAASASVRIVQSPTRNNYGTQGRLEPRITKTKALNIDAENNSLDITNIDLPAIELYSKQNIIPKTKQPPQIETEELSEVFPQKKLAINSVFRNKRNSLTNRDYLISVDNSENIASSDDADSGHNPIHASNRVIVFDGTSDDEFNATNGDDIFYLGSDSILEGGRGDDKFFVQSGGDNILLGGKGSDEFWIFNGEIPESANIIADFEVGKDVIGILGSSSLGIDASTLDFQEVDGNTEVLIKNQTLAVFYNVTASDINSSIVFI
ncbi:MAG: hypothetical protein AAFV71_15670 [Cyanobacteria bacterium J06633_8]